MDDIALTPTMRAWINTGIMNLEIHANNPQYRSNPWQERINEQMNVRDDDED